MGEIAYRAFVYPLLAVVAAAGLVGGRWLETSGVLQGLIEQGGTSAGVPPEVFEEGPGRPPAEAGTTTTTQDQQDQQDPDAGTTQTSPSPSETSPTTEETTSPTEESSPTESPSSTEDSSPTESPSPAPS